MHMWNGVDPDRCGIVPKSADADFTLNDYARWVFDTPACVVVDKSTENGWRTDSRAFKDIYKDRHATSEELEHALSMEWPDVRLKKFVEIRPADALELPELLAYCALIKGLFYGPHGKDALDELFFGVKTSDIEHAKLEIIEHGWDALVYKKPVSEYIDALFAIAKAGLPLDETAFLEPLESLSIKRISPRENTYTRLKNLGIIA